MLETRDFGKALSELSYDFYSGVPCSFLKYLINYAINEEDFVMAVNEGDAIAICSGAYLGGRKPVFLCQNSGLANAVSPLTSLTHTFKIPILGFVSLRGEPGLKDEPQHELMGQITSELLDTMRINHAVLSPNISEALLQLQEADKYIENGKSFFFIVKKGTFAKVDLKGQKQRKVMKSQTIELTKESQKEKPLRIELLNSVKQITDSEMLVLATTGLTGRELYELGDTANQLYMVGSMGCVSSIALGLAVAQPNKKVVAIDGDGALLMRMGAMATLSYYSPNNVYHLLLDNGAHESTGAQATVSPIVNFAQVASATGYTTVNELKSISAVKESLKRWNSQPTLTFGYCKTAIGTCEDLGRPTVTPVQVKDRFIQFVNNK
ncbi:phosphonopyruvate decarboxylase [Viridibacillus sp. YIM B01967]|uniref:Phosphonopyruvate decarboxylase n=1 Tax=Viridibacillus soli TaxID=2798301 RepID=A0ABS1H5Z6_9BACL|nr:phosphonopyruvate decarboxylase [Viridibacillus soli]MBK3494844.1 phosphonopyruvate decarboxylase [Viridibacillus soli]